MLGGVGYARFSHVAGSEDTGRAALTDQSADRYVFRIAPLRNVALTYPYFHDGSASTLEEAVAVMSESQTQTVLSAQDRGRIVAFLESLTGEFPQVPYPVLPR
jgi:cytochrome c peroxidase